MNILGRRLSSHFSSAAPVYDEPFNDDEMETFDVELRKDFKGLGITIAGFVGGEGTIDNHSMWCRVRRVCDQPVIYCCVLKPYAGENFSSG